LARRWARKPLSDRILREVFLNLTKTLIRYENGGLREGDLLNEVSRMLFALFQCEAVEIWFGREPSWCRYATRREGSGGYQPPPPEACQLARMCRSVMSGRVDPDLLEYTKTGSLWIEDLLKVMPCHAKLCEGTGLAACPARSWRSLAVMPLGDKQGGALILSGPEAAWFRPKELPFLVDIAQTIGMGIAIEQRQEALGERVKELTCLFGLSRLAQRKELPLFDLLQKVAELVPPAWQYPEFAHCRITFGGEVFESADFQESLLRQGADFHVKGEPRGGIEVFYDAEAQRAEGGSPFLPEEWQLIEGLARDVSSIIERRQLDRDREDLWEQLRHMDRLATIGQLTTSVAHELNEPLCSILGLSQLAIKDQELSPQAKRDIRKIIASSLHARDVVKGLLEFSRPTPARRTSVALNRILDDVVDLFKARCARAKVTILRELDPFLQRIVVDPSHVHQILVNLVVNAIQAMPEGGRLTLGTRMNGERVQLSVGDSGVGMNDNTLRQVFVPFFTTKEVGQGTGLGLGIVRNLVTIHGGTIAVESQVGTGSRFIIEFPGEVTEGLEECPHA
jgi:two-component system NtrC family sensor kinase